MQILYSDKEYIMKKNKEKYWLMVGLPYIQRFFVVEGILQKSINIFH